MLIKDIIDKSEYSSSEDVSELDFENIVYRTEDITSKSVYFHIKSSECNLDSISECILEKRPVCVVGEIEFYIPDIPSLCVKNARKLLSFAFARFFNIDFSRLKFVGITGTNGKTTTAHMIKAILEEEGHTVGFIGTGKIESDKRTLTPFDYSMTTPDPDILYSSVKRMENDGCDHIVMEVSSHALALEKLSPITFAVSVFTNLSHEHLDFHGDMEIYYKTKMKLFEKSKLGIFNIDDAYGRRAFSECSCEKKSIGILWDAEAVAKEPELRGFSGSSYLYRAKDFIFRMNLPLVGAYNIYNSLCAICAADALGCRPCAAKRALEKMPSPSGRFEIIEDTVRVIIDYAHTPLAFENVLKTINSCKNQGQKLICVFGCGGMRDKEKRPLMGHISELSADLCVITEDNSRGEDRDKIISDIESGISDKCRCVSIPVRAQAIESAILNAEDGSIIAILGKGAERYNIDKNGTHPFDERKIILEALKKRKELGSEKHEYQA